MTTPIEPATNSEPVTEVQKLQREIDILTKGGIIEVAIRNPSVAEYMHHWEGRALKAEAFSVNWLPISEADNGIAYIINAGEMQIGNSYPVWVRDADGRVYEALWSDNGKKAYWWDIEGESPVDPVEFMPHPLARRVSFPRRQSMNSRVKPLEWAEAGLSSKSDRLTADSIVGQYEVLKWADGTFGGTLPGSDGEHGVEFTSSTMDAAKATAQADYEQRIFSAISAQTAPAEVVTVEFDECLNDLGWQMNEFLNKNGATFDGRVFNNMKAFLHGAITQYIASTPPTQAEAREAGIRETGLLERVQAVTVQSGSYYCRYIRQMEQTECLGSEAKIKTGVFGKKELDAHSEAHRLLGWHQALVAVRRALLKEGEADHG